MYYHCTELWIYQFIICHLFFRFQKLVVYSFVFRHVLLFKLLVISSLLTYQRSNASCVILNSLCITCYSQFMYVLICSSLCNTYWLTSCYMFIDLLLYQLIVYYLLLITYYFWLIIYQLTNPSFIISKVLTSYILPICRVVYVLSHYSLFSPTLGWRVKACMERWADKRIGHGLETRK